MLPMVMQSEVVQAALTFFPVELEASPASLVSACISTCHSVCLVSMRQVCTTSYFACCFNALQKMTEQSYMGAAKFASL